MRSWPHRASARTAPFSLLLVDFPYGKSQCPRKGIQRWNRRKNQDRPVGPDPAAPDARPIREKPVPGAPVVMEKPAPTERPVTIRSGALRAANQVGMAPPPKAFGRNAAGRVVRVRMGHAPMGVVPIHHVRMLPGPTGRVQTSLIPIGLIPIDRVVIARMRTVPVRMGLVRTGRVPMPRDPTVAVRKGQALIGRVRTDRGPLAHAPNGRFPTGRVLTEALPIEPRLREAAPAAAQRAMAQNHPTRRAGPARAKPLRPPVPPIPIRLMPPLSKMARANRSVSPSCWPAPVSHRVAKSSG